MRGIHQNQIHTIQRRQIQRYLCLGTKELIYQLKEIYIFPATGFQNICSKTGIIFIACQQCTNNA